MRCVIFCVVCLCLQELQEQWERARAEEQSRGAGAADVRRWTGIRNIVEAREMLRTLFISACTQRAQVSWLASLGCELRSAAGHTGCHGRSGIIAQLELHYASMRDPVH